MVGFGVSICNWGGTLLCRVSRTFFVEARRSFFWLFDGVHPYLLLGKSYSLGCWQMGTSMSLRTPPSAWLPVGVPSFVTYPLANPGRQAKSFAFEYLDTSVDLQRSYVMQPPQKARKSGRAGSLQHQASSFFN